jgi:biotin operon repressor
MATRKRGSRKASRSKRRLPGTVRQIKRTSPKGKIALLMMEGRHSYAAIAKKTRTTLNNIYQHAKQLRAHGHKISVKDGVVRLLASAKKVFAS